MTEKTKVNEKINPEQPETEAQTEATTEIFTLEDLQQQLAKKTAEAEENHNRILRVQADFDNFRRRTRQEKADLLNFAGEELITSMLPVLDNFERALSAAPKDEFASGVEMIYRQLKDVLNNQGLETIPAVGEEFDPNYHDAVMQVDSAEHKENTIVQELRRGYILKGKVIRHTMVQVAK